MKHRGERAQITLYIIKEVLYFEIHFTKRYKYK